MLRRQKGGMKKEDVEDFFESIDEMMLVKIREENVNYGGYVLSEDSINELEVLPPFFSLYRNDFDRVLKRIIEDNELHYGDYDDEDLIKVTLTSTESKNKVIGWCESMTSEVTIADVTQQTIEPEIVTRLEELTKDEQQKMAELIFHEEIGKNDLGPVILRLLAVECDVRADGDRTVYRDYPNNNEQSVSSCRRSVATPKKYVSIRRLRNKTLKNIRMGNARKKSQRKRKSHHKRKSHRRSISK